MPSLFRAILFSVPLSLLACSNSDPSSLSCAELADALHARATSTSASCSTAADCTAVGYPVRDDGTPTCNCGVTFARSCGGDAVNRAAWVGDSTAAAMLAEWNQRCVPEGIASGAPDLCDCSLGDVTCSAEGQCVSSARFCGSGGGDAGVQ